MNTGAQRRQGGSRRSGAPSSVLVHDEHSGVAAASLRIAMATGRSLGVILSQDPVVIFDGMMQSMDNDLTQRVWLRSGSYQHMQLLGSWKSGDDNTCLTSMVVLFEYLVSSSGVKT
jgi:hypothetical protein